MTLNMTKPVKILDAKFILIDSLILNSRAFSLAKYFIGK